MNNMIFISHRGNIDEINPERENSPDYILQAIAAGYDVEIDVREINGKLFLGHDEPQYEISLNHEIFTKHKEKLWIHCKNIPVLHTLIKYPNYNVFFHDSDECTLTSRGHIWTYPGKSLGKADILNKSICVLPELSDYKEFNCCGICSDKISFYKNKMLKKWNLKI